MWRQHFLDTMSPRHLPPLWSVDHQADRLETKAADNRIDMEQYRIATEGVATQLDLEAYRAAKHVQLGINPDCDKDECDDNDVNEDSTDDNDVNEDSTDNNDVKVDNIDD